LHDTEKKPLRFYKVKRGCLLTPSFYVIKWSLVFHYLKYLVFIVIAHLYKIQAGWEAVE
jgi:hypothetical protein